MRRVLSKCRPEVYKVGIILLQESHIKAESLIKKKGRHVILKYFSLLIKISKDHRLFKPKKRIYVPHCLFIGVFFHAFHKLFCCQ